MCRRRLSFAKGIQPLLLAGLLSVTGLHAQGGVIDFESDRWVLKTADVTTHLGRKCLSGYAYLKDVEFEDGIIEVDIAVDDTKTRSYPGIIFRMQSEENYERLYIRPHRAPLYSDALQYTPVFNGIAGWQLYNGEGFTALCTIPDSEWVHVEVEVSGTQARVYVGDNQEPALVIRDLKHGVSKGTVGLFGDRGGVAWFSNFKYRIDNGLEFAPPLETVAPLGMMRDWELSQPFDVSKIDLERSPHDQGLTDIEWRKVQAEPDGLVDIARFVGRIGGAADCVFARTMIHSEDGEVKTLLFGYSDAISIFLNGRIVFFGNSAYRQRDPSFLGIVGLHDAVYLPLKRGENELLLTVAESFGGWGFICQDGTVVFRHDMVTQSWELPWKLTYPESVVYDKKRGVLYVSNYSLPGRGFISKVNLSGEIEDLTWIGRLNRPTGLCVFRDKLYAVDRDNLAEIDVASGRIEKRYPLSGAQFPNDVAFDPSGNAYISDSRANVIYKLSNGACEVWMQSEEITNPNGLCVDENRLIVGNSGDGSVKAIDLSDKQISTIASLGAGSIMDGVKPDGRGGYVISDYNGRVFLISSPGEKTELLNTTAPKHFCADLEYIVEENLLIIPTLYDNRLMAYRLKTQ